MKVSHAVLLFLVSNSACQCFRHDLHLAVDALGKPRHGNTTPMNMAPHQVAPAVFEAVAATSPSSRKLPQDGPDLNNSSLLSPTVKDEGENDTEMDNYRTDLEAASVLEEEHGGSNMHSMVESYASMESVLQTTDHRFNASSAIEKSATTILSYANATGPEPIIERQMLKKQNRFADGGFNLFNRNVLDERQVELWEDKLVYYTPPRLFGAATPTELPLEGFQSKCTAVDNGYDGQSGKFSFRHSKRGTTNGGNYIFVAENSICHLWCDEINILLCSKRDWLAAGRARRVARAACDEVICSERRKNLEAKIQDGSKLELEQALRGAAECDADIKLLEAGRNKFKELLGVEGSQYFTSNGKVLVSAATTDPCCWQESIAETENGKRPRWPCVYRDGGCGGGSRKAFQQWVDSCDRSQNDICINYQQYEYQATVQGKGQDEGDLMPQALERRLSGPVVGPNGNPSNNTEEVRVDRRDGKKKKKGVTWGAVEFDDGDKSEIGAPWRTKNSRNGLHS